MVIRYYDGNYVGQVRVDSASNRMLSRVSRLSDRAVHYVLRSRTVRATYALRTAADVLSIKCTNSSSALRRGVGPSAAGQRKPKAAESGRSACRSAGAANMGRSAPSSLPRLHGRVGAELEKGERSESTRCRRCCAVCVVSSKVLNQIANS